MFLEVKEFALHLYVESKDPERSRRVEGGMPMWSTFSALEPESLFKNFEGGS